MATLVFGERGAVFNYGLLSTKTSRLLKRVVNNPMQSFSEEEFRIFAKAKTFLDQIIDGQRLMEGEKGGFKASLESVEAVSHALRILSVLRTEQMINEIKDISDIKKIFEGIRDVIQVINERQFGNIDGDKLYLARNFFLLISRKFVSDAQELAQLHPPMTL